GGEARLVRSRRPLIAEDSKHHFDSCQASVMSTFTRADESHHWSLTEDTAYFELLASREAVAAQKASSLEEAAELTRANRLRLEELDKEKALKEPTASAKVASGLLRCLHSYRMQYLYEEGSVRVLDRTLLHAFTQEFTRVNLLVWEDLRNEIVALVNHLGTRFDTLIDYIKGTSPGELSLRSRSSIIGRVQQCRLEWATELMAFGVRTEGARNEMENFLQQCLQEVSSREETKKLVSELAERWTRLESVVQEVVLSKEMDDPSVAVRVSAALAGGPTFQGNYVLGSLEALLGSLRLSSNEGEAPVRSTSMAIAERQISSLSQAFGDTERNFLTERLHPNYTEAFTQQRSEAIPKAFQEPLLPGLISAMDHLRLETPGFQDPVRPPLSEEELSAQESTFDAADEGGRERIFRSLVASYKVGFDRKAKPKSEPQPQSHKRPTGEPDQKPAPPDPELPSKPKVTPKPLPEPQRPPGPRARSFSCGRST
ncbi:MAG: hypothetical protein MJE68_06045, partial [Proteobacteria bacterium]|nr:hypothetical protein [Pseudomonadota bacterium]